jgi:hypothetical protein
MWFDDEKLRKKVKRVLRDVVSSKTNDKTNADAMYQVDRLFIATVIFKPLRTVQGSD